MCPVSGLDASGFIQVLLLLLLLLLPPLPLMPNMQFVGLWTCGHMMSKKALDATADAPDAAPPAALLGGAAAAADHIEVKTAGSGSCPVCGAAFAAADIIPILPAEADRELRRR